MNPTASALVFDVMRYAIHDGPGIRTTVFFKGCPLRCAWCANPESQKPVPELSYTAGSCLLCGRCAEVCPQGAITVKDDRHEIRRDLCQACGTCAQNCPAGALTLLGRTVTPEALFDEVTADRIFWDRSGGGVTLSGGEPLAQGAFCREFLRLCRDRYISTAVETCLQAPREAIEAADPFVDHWICDLKIADGARHKIMTGVDGTVIRNNLDWLAGKRENILVRMPLIPGVNDPPDDLDALAAFLAPMQAKVVLEIMPYHRLGESKYERLGRDYPLKGFRPPAEDHVESARNRLRNLGLQVVPAAR